jgi:hypothetical protein
LWVPVNNSLRNMKSLSGFIRSQWYKVARARLEREVSARAPKMSLDRSNWAASLKDPITFYFECLRYFYQELPSELRQHRDYFYNPPSNRRGFGEHPFHVMWYLLFREFKPANFLEIGVFRGQTISLAAFCARLSGASCEVYGISPFSAAGDSVSKYSNTVEYYADTLANFDHFGLPQPTLVRAFSTDEIALRLIRGTRWEMVYIDGNHEYEVARRDWEACAESAASGAIIVLDDAALTTDYNPPGYAGSRGHPGPSRLAQEINRDRFREILQVGHNRVFQKLS